MGMNVVEIEEQDSKNGSGSGSGIVTASTSGSVWSSISSKLMDDSPISHENSNSSAKVFDECHIPDKRGLNAEQTQFT